jgi:hypothetical protein
MGVEPMTCRLRIGCSTSKLRWRSEKAREYLSMIASSNRLTRQATAGRVATLRARFSPVGPKLLARTAFATSRRGKLHRVPQLTFITIFPKCEPLFMYS